MGLLAHKIRVLIRTFGTPMDRKHARKWQFRFSIMYNLSAATIFFSMVYYTMKNYDPSSGNFGEIITAREIAERFGRTNSTTVLTLSGLNEQKREVIDTDESKCSEDYSSSSEETLNA